MEKCNFVSSFCYCFNTVLRYACIHSKCMKYCNDYDYDDEVEKWWFNHTLQKDNKITFERNKRQEFTHTMYKMINEKIWLKK